MTFTTRHHHDHEHQGQGHDHAVGLGETFDFLNTLELEEGSPVDHLTSIADAVAWFEERGLLHDEFAATFRRTAVDGAPSSQLERIRRTRAALREVADAVVERRRAAPSALREVNRVLRSRTIPRLDSAPDGVWVGHEHGGDPLDDALARLAEPIVHEIATGRPERLRVCANDRCRWVFFDSSPTGRRRWCDMASCGNRAKAARHRARVRQTTRRRRTGSSQRASR
ncbi:MAG TPA: CGNR zinc finger domain-containing protein [Candidatus Limnocylindrales bacterium]